MRFGNEVTEAVISSKKVTMGYTMIAIAGFKNPSTVYLSKKQLIGFIFSLVKELFSNPF